METLLRLPEVRASTRKSTTSIYRDMRAGKFPRPVAIGDRAVAWRESDLKAWLEARSVERRALP